MKLELKNLKYHADLSEETPAYSASLYVDGKKVGQVSNRGHGGCDEFTGGWKLYEEISKQLPEGLEYWCHIEIDRHLLRKQMLKKMKTKVLVFNPAEKSISEFSWKGIKQITNKHVEHIEKTFPELEILNMMPADQALEYFDQYTR